MKKVFNMAVATSRAGPMRHYGSQNAMNTNVNGTNSGTQTSATGFQRLAQSAA